MAYIAEYEYDIFISYSHIDNEKTVLQSIGWIEQFFKDLTVTLWQSIGTREIKIWLDDRRLNGGTVFDDEIAHGIKSSAILLCLNSPGYLKSEYCKKELELFSAEAVNQRHGLRVGRISRVFNVLLYNIPHTKWPTQFDGTTGFPFHDALTSESKGHPVELDSKRFREELEKLTDALVELIEEIKGQPEPPPPPSFSIFFGDVSDSLRRVRKRTVAELEKKGYNVTCNLPPPFEYEEHVEILKEKVGESKLLVHLLDQYPGREVEGKETCWYPQMQAELGIESAASQLIWVPADLNINSIEEDPFKNFIESVERGKYTKEIEFIRGMESDLPKQIIDIAEQIKVRGPKIKTGIPVLIDTHFIDQKYALDLGSVLLGKGVQPFINPQEDDPLKNINILEDRIGQVSNVVFIFGKVKADWISERLNAARKLIVTNDYPIDEFLVYMFSPIKDLNNKIFQQRFIKVKVFDNSGSEDLQPGVLAEFIKSLKPVQ